jgi:hypothetical protein
MKQATCVQVLTDIDAARCIEKNYHVLLRGDFSPLESLSNNCSRHFYFREVYEYPILRMKHHQMASLNCNFLDFVFCCSVVCLRRMVN